MVGGQCRSCYQFPGSTSSLLHYCLYLQGKLMVRKQLQEVQPHVYIPDINKLKRSNQMLIYANSNSACLKYFSFNLPSQSNCTSVVQSQQLSSICMMYVGRKRTGDSGHLYCLITMPSLPSTKSLEYLVPTKYIQWVITAQQQKF